MIELVILDIDGVLTDGKKYYDKTGMPFAKTYCDKDFTAIKRFRGAGVSVCFLSGDENVNKEMAKNRNIPLRGEKIKQSLLIRYLKIFKQNQRTWFTSVMIYLICRL